MKPLLTKLAFMIVLVAFAQTANAQIIYIDLNIEQPYVEDCITGIETNFQTENIAVIPNPAKDLFTLEFNNLIADGAIKISIFDLNGQEIYTEELNACNMSLKKNIDLSGHASGIYLLNVTSKEKYYKAKIILK